MVFSCFFMCFPYFAKDKPPFFTARRLPLGWQGLLQGRNRMGMRLGSGNSQLEIGKNNMGYRENSVDVSCFFLWLVVLNYPTQKCSSSEPIIPLVWLHNKYLKPPTRWGYDVCSMTSVGAQLGFLSGYTSLRLQVPHIPTSGYGI